MLEALLRASPAHLSATELLRKCLGRKRRPLHQTVQVTISRLRSKLGEPQVVETTAGVGYSRRLRLVPEGDLVTPRDCSTKNM